MDSYGRLVSSVIMEHLVIGVKVLLMFVIEDTPVFVHEAKAAEQLALLRAISTKKVKDAVKEQCQHSLAVLQSTRPTKMATEITHIYRI